MTDSVDVLMAALAMRTLGSVTLAYGYWDREDGWRCQVEWTEPLTASRLVGEWHGVQGMGETAMEAVQAAAEGLKAVIGTKRQRSVPVSGPQMRRQNRNQSAKSGQHLTVRGENSAPLNSAEVVE